MIKDNLTQTDPATVSFLLNLANDMRRANKDEELDDLPTSIRSDSQNCIIANAFNYSCSVDPGDEVIIFKSDKDVDTYFKVMGLNKDNYNYDDPYDEYSRFYHECEAPMTSELVEIAVKFDYGELFEEYADYERNEDV